MRINYLHFDLNELDWLSSAQTNDAIAYYPSGNVAYEGNTLQNQPIPHGVGKLYLENGKELYHGTFNYGYPNPSECNHVLQDEVVEGKSDLVLFCRCCNSVIGYIKKIKPGIN